MFSYTNARSLLGVGKRLRFTIPSRALSTSNPDIPQEAKPEISQEAKADIPQAAKPEDSPAVNATATPSPSTEPEPTPSPETQNGWVQRMDRVNENARLPRSVQAVYLRPLRRKAEHGLPVCDLQLRSYSVRNVEFFADFAIRAAYYLKLPVSGPIPLPRITERWTVPRSNFVHKKSQENFERITLRRLIQIKDGNPQVVQAWLAFIRKHAFYGVGMKANIWEHEALGVSKSMDNALPEVEKALEPHLAQFGQRKDAKADASIFDRLNSERFAENKSPLSTVRNK